MTKKTADQEIASIEAKLARLKTEKREADRRADAHRKIGLGGLIIAAGADKLNEAEIVGALQDYLDHQISRQATARERGIKTLESRAKTKK